MMDLMSRFVNHWSPLTHSCHCITTTRPAAATQMRVAVQPKVFLYWMPFCGNPCHFRARRPAQSMLACISWL